MGNPTPREIDEMKAIIDGVDFYAKTMEKKWGVDRLRLLVDADLRSRFDQQLRMFNDAIFSYQLGPVREHAEAMMRGWKALDEAARLSGADLIAAEVWEVRMPSGKVCALVRDEAEARHVAAEGRYVEVWTVEEVGRMIEGPWKTIGKVKQAFPGALVADYRSKELPNDELPF
ncbi:MAG: hypothetical protein CBC23_009285 [Rhodospirillaceae bacterium TMED63]|nr:MAG: hypothetical protein CBC23_009285 [Rhodospirillaceae bacterium TMED63]